MKKNRSTSSDTKKGAAGGGIRRRKPQLLALEPRLMFDGAAAAAMPEQVAPALADVAHHAADANAVDTSVTAVATTGAEKPAETQAPAAVAPESQRREIVFVDTSVADWQKLVGGVREGVEVVLLDPQKDAFTQMADRLAGERGLDAIHVVSHGSDGVLLVGGTPFDQASLSAHAAELETIGRALGADGDILLYGCDIAHDSTGVAFIQALANATDADVAASTDTTGSAAVWGGNWVLEAKTGTVDAALFATDAALAAYETKLATLDLSGKTGWTAIMYGTAQDPQGDSQAQAADTDIVADATHGSLYVAFDDNGTTGTADDSLAFRIRVDNPSGPSTFSGVAVVGIDANLDGRIDAYLMVDGRNSSQSIRIMDAGTALNNSASTATPTPLPAGWLPNNGVYPMSGANYSVTPVSSSSDPHWDGDSDVGNDGKTDLFISFRVSMSDLAAVMAKASPTDRDGNYGPRGSTGLTFTKDSAVRYVSFTMTQASGSINGDLNGVGAGGDPNAPLPTTDPMTPSNPVNAAASVTIARPIDANGYLNATEDNAFGIGGKATASQWVRVTITDSLGASNTVWTQANASGNWTLPAQDLSGKAEGTLTFTAALVSGNGSNTIVAGSTGDAATLVHDTLAPGIAVTPVATVGRPTIGGTSTDVPAGSTITVAIDPNGDGVLTDLVTYSALVSAGGAWSVDTAVVAPTTGSVPASGFTAHAKVTASGQDAAGNTASVTALDKPTVNMLATNSTTPTITGTWGGSNGGTDTLTVRVNGTTYTTAGGNLTVSGNTWTLAVPGSGGLAVGNSYDVVATAARGGLTTTDASTGELSIVSGPSVAITSAAQQSGVRPTVSGTSTVTSGQVVVRIDPNNDGVFGDGIYYAVNTDAAGNWTLNTATAVPVSGSLPVAGLTGPMGVLVTATDAGGRSATAGQTVAMVRLDITGVSSTATATSSGTVNADTVFNNVEDGAIRVTGVATNADGQTVTITIADSDASTADITTTAVVSGGAFTASGIDVSALGDSYLTVTAAITGASDVESGYLHDKTLPLIRIQAPSIYDRNTNNTITGTSDLAPGSTITVTVANQASPGTIARTATATVGANGDWSVSLGSVTGNPSGVIITATPSATAADSAGNISTTPVSVTVSADQSVTYATGAIAINAIATDNVIDGSEAASAVTIAGTTNSATNGATVTVTVVNTTTGVSRTYTPTTSVPGGTAGTWSASMSAADVAALGPSTTLVVTASVAITTGGKTVTYNDVQMVKLQLGSAGTSTLPTVQVTGMTPDTNLSAAEDDAVVFSGTSTNAVGSTVTVTVGGVGVGTATVQANGTWSLTSNLSARPEGSLAVVASVTVSGNTATDTLGIGHDTIAPAIGITSGPSTATTTPVIAGTSDLGAGTVLTITVDADGNGSTDVTYAATVGSGGTWSVNTATAAPASGTLPATGITTTSKVSVTGTDGAGNSSTVVAASITGITSDLGVSSSDFITRDNTLQFSGRAAAGASVTLVLGATTLATVTADGSGAWTYAYLPTVADGTYTLTATASQGAGLTAVSTQQITIDTAAPAVAITAVTDDSAGASATDFITNDNAVVFSGTAETGASVQVTLTDAGGATVFTSTVAAAGGAWSVDRTGSTLADGTYTLTAVSSDTAGNSTTTTRTVVIDTSATLAITTNAKTSDTTPVITGTSDFVSRPVTVTIAGNTYNTVTDAAGNWSVDLGTATPGVTLVNGTTYTITVTGTDTAGNAASASKTLLVDTAAPVLTVTEPIGDGDLNSLEDDAVVLQGATVNVPNGAVVQVTITDGTLTIADTATVSASGANGTWSLAALNLSAMNNGTLTVTVTYTDDAGITYSDAGTVLHNKGGAVSIDSISNDTGTLSDFITSDATLVFRGSASAGATVTLNLAGPGGGFTGVTVTANASGAWTYDHTGTTLSSGTYTLQAVGGTTVSQAIVIDTAAPAGPVTVDTQTTSDTTPTITGTATVGAGETLHVTVNGVTYSEGDGKLSRTGSAWTLVIPVADALAPASVSGGFSGFYDVVATVRDAAGNATSDGTTAELRVVDGIQPVLDLDPSNAGSTGNAVTYSGTSVSLDDGADPATLVEASDLVPALEIAVSGLQDGANEKLLFGTTAIAADGSAGGQANITVGGVLVNVAYAAGAFTIQRADYQSMTAAEAQAILRDLQYRNDLASCGAGSRTFTFTVSDDAGNVSDPVVATVTVVDATAPVVDLDGAAPGTGRAVTSNDGAQVSLDNDASPASVVEASNRIGWIRITPSGLLNGAGEQLVFGATQVAADGSGGNVSGVGVGGVLVDIAYAGGVFTVTKTGGADFSTAEAQSVLQGLAYRNTSAGYTPGARSFAIVLQDNGGNASLAATSTVTVADATAPVVDAGQSFSYAENQAANASVGTVTATDAVGVTGWCFSNGTQTSSDGWFTIDNGGVLRLTAVGAAAAANDFETAPNTFSYGVQALDAANNVSAVQNVTLNVTNLNDNAPVALADSRAATEDTAVTYTAAMLLGNDTDADGSALTIASVTSVTGGTAVLNGDGTVTFTPAANFNGAASFTYTVTDGTFTSAPAAVTVTVAAVNDAPTAVGGSLTTAEDTAGTGSVSATDPDSGTFTYAVVSGPSHGSLSLNAATGAYTYTPNADYNGPDSFTFKANDGSLDSNVATVSITVTAVNDAPVAAGGSASTAEDTALNGTVSASDVEGSSLTYSVVSNPSHGTLTLNASTGAYTYTPAANYNGPDSFTFMVNDGTADSNVATVNLTVTAVNDAPSASGGSLTTAEDTGGSGTLVAADVDSGSLNYSIVSGPTHGTLSIDAATGAYTYTPNADYNGPDSFTFKANDGSLDSNVATVSITVTAVNDAPIATGGSATTAEDTPASGTVSASDADGNTLSYSVVTPPAHGTVSLNPGTGAWTYTPAANYNGPDSFTFEANDGSADSNVATVSLTVTAVNDAPTASDGSATTAEDTVLNGTVSASDVDSGAFTYSVVTPPAHGTLVLNATTGAYTYTSAANYGGADSFTFKANDGGLDSNVATVSLTVTAVNDAPVANGASASTAEDTALNGTLTATDVDGSALTYSVVANPSHGTLTLNASTGAYTYTPAANYSGPDSFTFKANDGSADSNVATVSLTVTAVNDAPVATDTSAATAEDTLVTGNVSVADIDSGSLSYAVVTGPAHGTVLLDPATGAWTYTPAANYNGTDSFTFQANDGSLDSNTATVNITVTPVNDAPVAAAASASTAQDASVSGTVSATDVEGSTLTYSVVALPGHGTLTFDTNTGAWTYAPAAGYTGSDSFTFQANDGSLDSNVATVSLAVVNSPTVVTGGTTGTGAEDVAAITGVLTATDPDGLADGTVYTVSTGPAHGTATINAANGAWSYTPAADYHGSDSFTVTITDDLGNTSTQVITLSVTPVSDTGSHTLTTAEDTALTVNASTILAGDSFEGSASITAVGGATQGTVSLVGGVITYTPNANATGSDSFTYTVSSGGVLETGTITVNVTAVNDAPVAANASATTSEDVAATGTVSATDIDSGTLSYSVVSGPAHGTVSLNAATGTWTYTPSASYNGPDSFTFQANDGSLDSNVATVSIAVTAVNDAPVANNAGVSLAEDASLSGTVGATDVEGSTLTYTLVAGPSHGSFTFNGTTGAYTYTPHANYNGPDSFTFQANDGTVDSNVATISLTVTPVNDAPAAIAGTLTTAEDTAASGNLSVTDLDSAAFTYTVLSGPAHGTLNLDPATGAYTYTPNANYTGPDSFTFQANDGSLDSSTATVSITVTGVNDAPVAAGASRTTAEDAAISGSVAASDVDGDAVTYSVVSGPTHGTLTFNTSTGAYTYTPAADYNGPDSFSFRANDGTVDSNVATVAITVTAVNDAPAAANGTATTPEDTAASGTLAATDVDNATLTYSVVTQPAHGTLSLDANSGAWTYTPAANYDGPDSFTWQASDGSLSSASATVSITVTPVNDAPVAAGSARSTAEDTAVSGNVGATDAEGSVLGYSVVTGPSHGTLTFNASGAWTYTPDADYNGPDSFTFKANDGTVDSNVATVSLAVTAVNDAPVATGGSATTAEDTALTGNVSATDADGNPVSYAVVTGPAHGTLVLDAATGAYTYSPAANYDGPDSFTFRASDGTAVSNLATVNLTVTAVNDAPVATGTAVTTAEDTPTGGTLNGGDVDNASLTYTVLSGPAHGTLNVDAATGAWTYTPAADYTGPDSFTWRASDGTLNSGIATVAITVTAVNDAPVATGGSATTAEDTAVGGMVAATDVDNASVTYSVVTGPAHGSVALDASTGAWTYTPAANYHGPDSFTFRANDGSADSNVATVSLTVTAVNDAPVATGASATTAEDTALNGTLAATDAEGSALTYTVVSGPAHGVLALDAATGAYTYTPAANYNGPDSFTFRANDGSADSSVATIALTVTAVNDAPVANGVSVITAQDTPVSGTVNASDVESASLAYILVSGPAHGTVTLDPATAAYTYTPAAGYLGPDSFTWKANDGSADSNVATVSLSVTNSPTTVTGGDNGNGVEDAGAITGALAAVDPDGLADGTVYAIATGPAHGTASIDPATGAWSYVPVADYHGTDAFVVRITDDLGNTSTHAVSINVTAEADTSAHTLITAEDTAATVTAANLLADDQFEGTPTITAVGTAAHGTVSLVGGAIKYTPDPDYNGSDSFTYTVSSGGVTESGTVSVTVTAANDAPVAGGANLATAEDTPLSGTVSATDVDGGAPGFVLVSGPAHGTLSFDGGTGAWTYKPAADSTGADSFSFKANDGSLDSSTATVRITVTPVNDAPAAAASTVNGTEDTALAGSLQATDVDNASFTYSVVSGPSHGTLVLDAATGAYTYTPAANYDGPDSFTWKAGDGSLDSNVATVSINLAAVNDAPVASGGSGATAEDTALSGTVGASDAEGSPLTYILVANPAHGTVTLDANTGAYVYTPAANYSGPDSFTFKANDGTADSNVATVSLTVTAVNDAPSALAGGLTTAEDATGTGSVSATDPDSGSFSYTVVSGPSHGSLSLNAATGAYTYTPNADYNGPDSFTFRANDGSLDSNVATVSITVTAVNDAPVATGGSATVAEDGSVGGTASATDIDNASLTYSVVTLPTHGTVSLDANTGAWTYTPAANYGGPDSFTFKANDGTADSNVATVSLTVTPVNDAPTANDTSATTAEDTVLNGTVSAGDIDGGTRTFSVVTPPAHGTLVLNASTGAYTYTPAANYNGTDSFTFQANDGSLDSNVGTVSLTITAMNDAPVATGGSGTTAEDTALNGTVSASDVEGDALTYSVVSNPSHGTLTLNASTGAYTYTPAANYNGPDSFTFKVNDGTVDSNVATVSLTVTAVNDAPVAADTSTTTAEDTPATGNVSVTDADSGTLSYTLVTAPTHGSVVLDPATGAWSYTPAANYSGPDSFTFRASDGSLGSNLGTVSLTVTPVNDAPQAAASSRTTAEDTAVSGTLPGSDVDGVTLTYAIVSGPAHGSLAFDAATGGYTYTPDADYTGADSFTWQASDGTLASAAATVSLTVTPVNDAPTATGSTVGTSEDTAVGGTLGATDIDSGTLSYAVVSGPAHGSVSLNSATGAWTYTPAADYHGPDSFTFRANDGSLDSNVATVSITVTAVNDAPVAVGASASTAQDTDVSGTVGASDVDGGTLGYSVVTGPAHGTLAFDNVTGAWTYTPNTGYTGGDSFTFQANDGSLDSNVATVNLSVVNNPTVVSGGTSGSGAEDVAAITGVLTATDPDGLADGTVYTVSTGPAHGTATINAASGAWSYTPAADYHGSDSFIVTITDDLGNTSTRAITLTVTPVSDTGSHTLTTAEDTAVTVNASTILAGDSFEGSASITAVGGATQGTVSLVGGVITYTPNANATGSDSFTYTVSSGGVLETGTITVNVTAVNDAPVAANASATTSEDIAATGTVSATDVDSGTLSYSVVSGPAHGTVSLNAATGAWTYTPSANYNGPDSFTFQANDGSLGSNVATVSITVTAVNDAPVANGASAGTAEDTALNGTLSGTDVEGSSLTYSVVGSPSHGTLTLNASTGAYTYTPAADYNGPDSFTFQVSDGTATSAITTVNLTVAPVNDAPVAAGGSATTAEDTPASGTMAATDSEGSALTYTVVTGPAHGTLTYIPVTGAWTYTPAANYNGPDSFTFKANDGSADSNVATVALTVTAVNDTPVAAGGSVSTSEDVALNGAVSASDVEGSTLAYSVVSGPSHGTLTLNAGTGAYTYTPAANYNGPDSFTFQVNDGTVDSNVATVNLTVTAVNDAPGASAGSLVTAEDTGGSGTLVASDVDGGSLTYAIVVGASHGTVSLNPATGAYTYTPDADYNGPDSFTFQASDGSLGSNVATVNVTVTAVNDAPAATGGSVTTAEDTPAAGTVSASDIDGGTLGYAVVSGPSHGTVSLNPGTGAWTYTPAANYSGPDSFTFRANDGTADSNVATVSLTVTAVNDAPVASSASLTTAEDVPLSGSVTATDVEGSALTYAVVSGPAHGTLSLNGATGAWTYTPTANYNGPDSFTFRANDGSVDSNLATISLTVTPVNDAPVAAAGSASTAQDTPVSGTVAATDLEGSTLTYTVVTAPAHGTLAFDNVSGAWTYTPAAGYTGTDSFAFQANDGSLDSSLATVSLSVVNNPTVVTGGGSGSGAEDNAITGVLTATDPDGLADGTVYTVGAAPAHGTVTIAAGSGAWSYTPVADFHGADTFTVTITDDLGNTSMQLVSVTVTPVADTGTHALTTSEDAALVVNAATILAGDNFEGGAAITGVGGAANGSVSFAGGVITYAPNANFTGSDSFTYTVSSGGALETGTITVNVTAVDDAPAAVDASATTSEDLAVTGTVSASDIDGGALSYSVVGGPAHGTVSLNAATGTWTYTPTADYHGPDSFTFKANDGSLDSNVATVSITVTAVDDAPVATSGSIATIPATPVSGTVLAGDVDSATLTYSVVAGPAHGALAFHADGTYTYTPAPGYTGPDSFTFKANDGSADSNVATVNIVVNTPSTITGGGNGSGTEDAAITGTLTATDPEGLSGPAAYAVTGGPAHGTASIDPATGAWTYTPAPDYNGGDSFTVTITDDLGATTTRVITVSVAPAADTAPVTLSTNEDTAATLAAATVLAADDFEGSATFTGVGSATNGTVSFAGGVITYTPNANFNGTDSFTYTVRSGGVDETGTITVDVAAVNDAPVAGADALTASQDTSATYAASALLANDSDVDGNPLAVTAVGNAVNGSVSLSGGTVTFTPAAGFTGTASFDYTVNDGQGGTATATATITVVDNTPPVIGAGGGGAPAASVNVVENTTAVASFAANESVTWTLGGPDAARFTVVGGNLRFVAAPDFEAPADADGNNAYQLTLAATDANGNTSSIAVTVNVTDADEAPPVITGPGGVPGAPATTATVPENATAVTTFSAGEAVSWTLSGPDAARFTIDAAGRLVFVAPPDYEQATDVGAGTGNNSYVVTVQARDAAGNASSQTLTVNVGNVDEFAPVLVDRDGAADAVSVNAGAGAGTGITVKGTDRDAGTTVQYSLVDDGGGVFVIDPATGVVTIADAAALHAGGSGAHTITVLALSSDGSRQMATFTIDVADDTQVTRRLDEDDLVAATDLPPEDFDIAFGGRDFNLAVSEFHVPGEGGHVFRSLAQGEFADVSDAALAESLQSLRTAFRDVLTQPGENAFRIAVRNGGEAALRVFRGIPDQEFVQSRDVRVQVPVDAFVHTESGAVVMLSARMADGRPLPGWLHFDPSTGRFEGAAPAGSPAELTVLVEARDRDGRHAEAIFRIRLQKAAEGRAGLSEQIRSVQHDTVGALRGLQQLAQGLVEAVRR